MRHIDSVRFCKDSQFLSGQLTANDLPRLAAEVLPESHFSVAWTAQGQAPHFLDITLKSTVQLKCQRCLGALTEAVDVSYRFLFVADEETAKIKDEESDDVDVLVHDRQFDLLSLLEDEMLMALPLVALHEVCPSNDPMIFLPKSDRISPFDALKNLKKVA